MRADFGAEFLVRPYLDGHIQDNREVAGFFQAQADFGVAGLARGTGSGARRRSRSDADAVHRNLDRDQRRQVHARDFERNDILHGNLGRGVFFGQHQAADQHGFVFVQRRVAGARIASRTPWLRRSLPGPRSASRPRACLPWCACADDAGENAAQRDFGTLRQTFQIRSGVRREFARPCLCTDRADGR